MKAYFIAILTLFTCIATVVRAQQMSELENGLTVCSKAKSHRWYSGMDRQRRHAPV